MTNRNLFFDIWLYIKIIVVFFSIAIIGIILFHVTSFVCKQVFNEEVRYVYHNQQDNHAVKSVVDSLILKKLPTSFTSCEFDEDYVGTKTLYSNRRVMVVETLTNYKGITKVILVNEMFPCCSDEVAYVPTCAIHTERLDD